MFYSILIKKASFPSLQPGGAYQYMCEKLNLKLYFFKFLEISEFQINLIIPGYRNS